MLRDISLFIYVCTDTNAELVASWTAAEAYNSHVPITSELALPSPRVPEHKRPAQVHDGEDGEESRYRREAGQHRASQPDHGRRERD